MRSSWPSYPTILVPSSLSGGAELVQHMNILQVLTFTRLHLRWNSSAMKN